MRGLTATLINRGQILLENRVVDMTSAIELNGTLQLNNGSSVALVDGVVELLESFVVVGDVSLVVFFIVADGKESA
ncbi:hypothetical protein PS1_038014 [Malus domestica]